MQDDREAKRYYVAGRVQGVGYRYFAQRAAQRLGLAGYVKNLGDGRVEVYAMGPAESMAALRTELERGPRSAQISSIQEETASIDENGNSGFSIEYD